MITGFMSEGTAAIGCIVRIEDMLEVDAGVEVICGWLEDNCPGVVRDVQL
jgi:hypothetical protein